MVRRPLHESWLYKLFWTLVFIGFIVAIRLYPYYSDKLNRYVQVDSDRKPPTKVTAKLVRVIDGDTLVVELRGHRERVRLIGIDTPECKDNPKAYRDSRRSGVSLEEIIEAGKQAKRYVEDLLKPGTILTLEFDVQKRDKYGRLLAYVYLEDGRMLNELLIREGLALVYTFPPNVRYVDRLVRAQQTARSERRGFWKQLFEKISK